MSGKTDGRRAYDAWWATAEGVPRHPDVTYDQDGAAWEAAAKAVTAAHALSGTGALMGDIIALQAERDRVTERIAELVTEGNELRDALAAVRRALVRDVNDRAVIDRAVAVINRVTRKPVSEEPAVVTEHLAEKIRGLVIPDEEG